ncbi:MAG: HDOD domain-containing protein [Mycobacteriales bacterium]
MSSTEAPADGAGMLVRELLLQLEQLPPAQAAALRVVQIVDDPDSSAAGVATAASVDPALTARMLRMANSAYYGLSGRVASASAAVTVIGFDTVRSLAALAAAGLGPDGELPPGFWSRGAATASGAALLARRVGADVPQAFCVGILHDLGTALLWRNNPALHRTLLARAVTGPPAHVLEFREYGATHATLGADVLGTWNFPEDLCTAIGRHHDPPSAGATPLRRALQGGIALAGLAARSVRAQDRFVVASLAAAGVGVADRTDLVAQVRSEGQALAGALLS